MAEAREYDRVELVRELRRQGPALLAHFQKQASLPELIVDSVASNTFRAFHRLWERPSVIFRSWATDRLTPNALTALGEIDCQVDFDASVVGLVADLAKHWQRRGGKPLPFGPQRKLVNLLLKAIVRWKDFSAGQRSRLIPFLHVPLDKYSILAVRRFANVGVRISNNATMAFVTTQKLYDGLQRLMRELAGEAGVPPICVDNLAWDYAHAA